MAAADNAEMLAAIEDAGWCLEHVGYVFVVTDERSQNLMLRGGQRIDVHGETVGIYLFRATQ